MVTVGEGKHYSLGLDLDFFTQAPIHEITAAGIELQKLLSRLLTFPLVTVAAVNGTYYTTHAHTQMDLELPLSAPAPPQYKTRLLASATQELWVYGPTLH